MYGEGLANIILGLHTTAKIRNIFKDWGECWCVWFRAYPGGDEVAGNRWGMMRSRTEHMQGLTVFTVFSLCLGSDKVGRLSFEYFPVPWREVSGARVLKSRKSLWVSEVLDQIQFLDIWQMPQTTCTLRRANRWWEHCGCNGLMWCFSAVQIRRNVWMS